MTLEHILYFIPLNYNKIINFKIVLLNFWIARNKKKNLEISSQSKFKSAIFRIHEYGPNITPDIDQSMYRK